MMNIDPQSRTPIYEQICRSIIELAANKLLLPGDKLPSVREISKQYSINPNTVSKAFGMLERDGIIYSVPGKGAFLSEAHDDVIRRNAELEFDQCVGTALKSGLDKAKLIEIVENHKENKGEAT